MGMSSGLSNAASVFLELALVYPLRDLEGEYPNPWRVWLWLLVLQFTPFVIQLCSAGMCVFYWCEHPEASVMLQEAGCVLIISLAFAANIGSSSSTVCYNKDKRPSSS